LSAPSPARLLAIAGSDSSGGAGIQADLKTFSAHGSYGMTAITAITAQNTLGVTAIQGVPAELVAAQIDAVLADPGVDAVKIGMLADAAVIAAVADRLGAARKSAAALPIVLDPVMIAKSGDALLADEAVGELARLFPLATLLTPNLPEAERLAGTAAPSLADRERLARRLGERCRAVLLKGGHGPVETGGAEPRVVDLLWDGETMHRFEHRRLVSRSTHGTGCSLSSAIAARLGRGESLVAAVEGAIDWLYEAIARAFPMGAGVGPVDHFWRQRPEAAGGGERGCLA
jgi:hydroxymethylpyrimidine kinase/phosphomethylpyrimidine kinase